MLMLSAPLKPVAGFNLYTNASFYPSPDSLISTSLLPFRGWG
jgi:hypothetical protein